MATPTPTMRVAQIGRAQLPHEMARLRAAAASCSFVAFDTELGGLSLSGSKPNLMDSVEERYQQLRRSAQAFPIVQFGLSFFTWRADDRVFEVQTVQFPIFPDCRGDHELPDRSFHVQAKCVKYIRDHGFDLNAWVDQGIGHLSHAEQEAHARLLLRSLREDVRVKFASDPATSIRLAESRHFVEEMKGKLTRLLALDRETRAQTKRQGHAEKSHSSSRPRQQSDADAIAFFKRDASLSDVNEKVHEGSWTSLVTAPLAPFRRYAVLHLVETEFDQIFAVDCESDNHNDPEVAASPWKRRLRLIAMDSLEDRKVLEHANEVVTREHVELRNLDAVGFTAVMDLLIESKRPLVGHNLLLDLMHCFEKFHAPIPRTCSAFLRQLHDWLDGSTIFDTKVLVEHAMENVDLFGERLEHSALEHVYATLAKDPFHGPSYRHIEWDVDNGRAPKNTVTLNAHQAGYDAFMTGAVFLRTCSGLGIANDGIANAGRWNRNDTDIPRSPRELEKFGNSIKLAQILPSVTLHLPGPFPADVETPSRDHIARVMLSRVCLTRLKTFHIQQCIAWALNLRSTKLVVVRYETKSSVYVRLPTAKHVEQLIEIRLDCKMQNGTEQDPLPSLGCVEVERCAVIDGATMPEEMDPRAPKKRKQLE